MLFVIDARFAKQQTYETKNIIKIHVTYHLLQHIKPLHVQMFKVAVPKFKRVVLH